ncbi:short chain dehydrogenase [Pigmentiphaga sp. NML080357]|uniref:SDR family oxidoreductase n=1 Tax=Pigmentiphaga sp. NML080357 TaxID=2008675 RepID=UPI000B41A1CC|nr:SDR family oxidoreductase [Pigmentiphaga sp. NML080357]OVZ55433.1 short chain dehydrogenase [Pigmentiphaga sp. NML080357]
MSETSPSSSRPVALVTGAARRIGREIALALARAGWNVAVHYATSRDAAQETCAMLHGLGAEAESFACDLSDQTALAALVPAVTARFGRIDAVVNNASTFEYDDARTFDAGMLQAHMLPNLVAPVVLARELATAVAARDPQARGVVVNLLDQKLWNYNPDFFSYTLSKAALEAATTMLAQALAPAVRVVGVAPGLTMISHLQTPQQFARTHAMAPLGHASHPEDVAHAVLFAVQNRSITGTTVLVDGGQHLVGFTRDFSMMNPPADTAPAGNP